MFEHIKKTYGVNPEIGKEILYNKMQLGVIVEDLGYYIGVNFYGNKAGKVDALHPTYNIEYLDTFGVIRRQTASQLRYKKYLSLDLGITFKEYLKTIKP